jgi:hypothetical protein
MIFYLIIESSVVVNHHVEERRAVLGDIVHADDNDLFNAGIDLASLRKMVKAYFISGSKRNVTNFS